MNTTIEEKTLFATGDKVFTHIGTGLYDAALYEVPVMLERVEHNLWKCISQETDEILGEGTTRNEAMREAFYHMAEKEGYDSAEAVRLDWILFPQKYRSYGGHKPRKPTVKKPASKVTHINTRRNEAEEAKTSIERVKKEMDHYRTAYNATLGGWHYYERDNDGKILGEIKGPFSTEEDMLTDILNNVIKHKLKH